MHQLDIVLTVFFTIGLLQAGWLSVAGVRRGIPSSLLIRAVWALTAIWVLLWPVYHAVAALFAALVIFAMTVLLALWLKADVCRLLVLAWADGARLPWPMLMFVLALSLAAMLFSFYPELGFGVALSFCLGLPLAHWLDRLARLKLHFPANPAQTLPGHLGLIVTVVICCGWSLHVYQQVGWFESLTATLLAGIAASAARGLIVHPFNVPFVAAAIGSVLWML
ncbi:MAG: hypothetical protein Q9M25_05915 [Mariprofundaceae bacterium]|nr:hypothetical protein [Mariprofundaceae bacterium]